MEQHSNKANPDKWLDLYGDTFYQYTLPRVNDRMAAEDIIQETFLSALKGLNGFKGDASEKNWLFTILKNKIIDFYRKKASQGVIVETSAMTIVDDDGFTKEGGWTIINMPKDWHSADTPLERKELQKIINKCKDHLKTLQQQVFTLKYMEGLEADEICKVLRISSSNYWVLAHRARLQMRNCVEKYWLKAEE